MARTNATNFTGPLQFPYATAGTDIFRKEDVQTLAQAVDGHDHSTGKGLTVSVAGIPAGAINGSQITDATITSAKITDGTIQSVDIAAAGIANDRLGPDVARANLLTNGSFDIWQRGNGPFTASSAVPFSADRWAAVTQGSGAGSVSRDATNQESGQACAAFTVTAASSGFTNCVQAYHRIADYATELRGRTLSVKFRVKSSGASNNAQVAWSDGVTGGGAWQLGAVTPVGTSYQDMALTFTMSTTATVLVVSVAFEAVATFYIDNAMLVVGSQPANYVPLHPADDLARCLRYYELVGQPGDGTIAVRGWIGQTNQTLSTSLTFLAQKAVTPTVTKVGTWGSVASIGQPTIAASSIHGIRIEAVAPTASVDALAINNQAGTNITAESNP